MRYLLALLLSTPVGSSVINPVTTLIQTYVRQTGTTTTEAETTIQTVLGISGAVDLTQYDPFAAATGDALALQVQQQAAQLATLAALASDDQTVFQAIATSIETASTTTLDLGDADSLNAVLGNRIGANALDKATTINQLISAADDLAAISTIQEGVFNDEIVVQQSSPSVIGAGIGDDIYLLSDSVLSAGARRTISDTQGSNSIQLAEGLAIASSKLTSQALSLTMTNGAVVTILGADQFGYDVGGDFTIGIDNADIDYGLFCSLLKPNMPHEIMPADGVIDGGAVVIGVSATSSSWLEMA